MKIAHIGNVAGISSILAKYQQNNPSVYCFTERTHHLFGGKLIDLKSGNMIRRIVTMMHFLKDLNGYDVWHYHYPYGRLKAILEKLRGKHKFLKHYHGDDLRGKHEDDFCVVSTPDLLQFAPNGLWLPSPIDLEVIDNIVTKPHNTVRIVRYPHHKMHVGNDYYSKALDEIQRKDLAEVITIFNRPHQECLEIISTCDIVLGKILPNVGWFGMFELEAMALSKTVTAFITDELYKKYRPPVYRVTKDTVFEDLQNLVENFNERQRLSNQGREYIKNNHEAAMVTAKVEQYYQQI